VQCLEYFQNIFRFDFGGISLRSLRAHAFDALHCVITVLRNKINGPCVMWIFYVYMGKRFPKRIAFHQRPKLPLFYCLNINQDK